MKKSFLQFGKGIFLAFGLLFFVANAFSQGCPDGMAGYWKMSELEGPIYQDAYAGNDAIAPTNSPSAVTGASGGGQSFQNGSGTYLTIPDNSTLDWSGTSSFSIEFWVKYSGSTGDVQVFVARDDRPYSAMTWWIGATTSGTISWYMQGTNGASNVITTGTAYNNNQWHHVVAVRNGSLMKNYLYVDGLLQNTGGSSFSSFGTLYSSLPLTIGGLLYNGSPGFLATAHIDELAIYNKALDPTTEIAVHYADIAQYQIGYCDGDDPVFISEPVTIATVGELYTYDVDASGNSKPIYSLIEKPDGMIINATTGIITWTPVTQSVNGRVVVRATNNKGDVDQSFFVLIADAPTCRPNLLAYWDFNLTGTAGYVDKIAGWELSGTSPGTTQGIIGTALSFDGVNDSLNLTDNLDPANIFFDFHDVPSFSIELWMKSNVTPSGTMVIVGREQPSNNTQYWLGTMDDGSVGFYLRDYPVTATPAFLEGGSVMDGDWHYIVASYNDNTSAVQLYVDNVLVDETTEKFTDFGGNTDLNIGHLNTSGDKYWYEGMVDELSFYNMALTPSQINSNYSNALLGQGACTFNYAPIIRSTPDSTVVQDELYSYEIEAYDANESDPLTISVVTAPSWMDMFTYIPGDSTATISGTPGNDDVGMNSVIVRVSDGNVNVDQEFIVRVVNVDDPPVFTSTPLEMVDQNANYSYKLTATDPDGDDLTFSAPVIPAWLTFNATTMILSGQAGNDDVGTHDITLSVTDGNNIIDQEYTLTVQNVNDAPSFDSDPILTVKAGESYLYQVNASDPDSEDELTFSTEIMPDWLTLTPASNVAIISGTPQLTNVGSHAVIIKVSDGELEDLQSFTITVSDPTSIEGAGYLVTRVYPIPAIDKVHFEFSTSGDVELKVYNVVGKLVKTENQSGDKLTLDISDLSGNMFFYSVSINQETSVGKLIKK